MFRTLFLLLIVLELLGPSHGFDVFWNVPTEQCHSYGIYFNLSEFNIIQNSEDIFHGDRINIIYRPGMFPYYDGDTPMWGGIPQQADLAGHIDRFQSQVSDYVPLNFTGFAVLDFEDYQPYFTISPYVYKNASYEWVRSKFPEWPEKLIQYVAEKTFNEDSKLLFELLIEVGKLLRPGSRWGYYHYPYCQNYSPETLYCKPEQDEANAAMAWLFRESGALYPSIYIFKEGWDIIPIIKQVRRRLINTIEIRGNDSTPILPYTWFKFHDEDTYLSRLDLWATIGQAWQIGLEGAIIWGSSTDVQSAEICTGLLDYTTNILGPLVKYWTEHPV